MTPALDFHFFIGSTYTYLSVSRAARMAAAAGVTLRWKPFFLRSILIEMDHSPFVGKPAKLAYMWRDLERRAAVHGLTYAGIPPYPVDPDGTANRVAWVAASQGWCAEYAQAIYRRWFLRKEIPGESRMMRALLAELGRDAEEVLALADGEEARSGLARQTDAARELGLFGSPSFVCGREVFWGDDRLEEALDWARGSHPAQA